MRISDWSSDVCSSDLGNGKGEAGLESMMRNNPHFDLYTDRRGYQLFEVTPKMWRTDVKVMDQVQTSGGKISTLARYSVSPDAPILRREGTKRAGFGFWPLGDSRLVRKRGVVGKSGEGRVS